MKKSSIHRVSYTIGFVLIGCSFALKAQAQETDNAALRAAEQELQDLIASKESLKKNREAAEKEHRKLKAQLDESDAPPTGFSSVREATLKLQSLYKQIIESDKKLDHNPEFDQKRAALQARVDDLKKKVPKDAVLPDESNNIVRLQRAARSYKSTTASKNYDLLVEARHALERAKLRTAELQRKKDEADAKDKAIIKAAQEKPEKDDESEIAKDAAQKRIAERERTLKDQVSLDEGALKEVVMVLDAAVDGRSVPDVPLLRDDSGERKEKNTPTISCTYVGAKDETGTGNTRVVKMPESACGSGPVILCVGEVSCTEEDKPATIRAVACKAKADNSCPSATECAFDKTVQIGEPSQASVAGAPKSARRGPSTGERSAE